ncbi:histidine phosphatase family protein [Kineococcus sp. T13]|uniref:histidine phosphatase family protein n=1 Tax=Kineococcus vitellinus TaxID=2696565 RepID=UPI001412D8A3|nr:histidine phosphatase family protein [Kineococcus vitellinus]
MTRTALVRHGETDWNRDGRLQGRSDVPLNDTGRAQARALAEAIADDGWTLVVPSPLSRARETAQLLAERLGIPLLPADDDLVERDFGEAEGMDREEIAQRYPAGERPGTEAWEDLVARAGGAVRRLRASHPDEHLLIVCHGTFIRAAVEGLAGVQVPRLGNASRVLLEGTDQDWRLLEQGSLAPLG